jgi:uncharacterized protein YyaL (SSP411 family)
MPNRLARSSSPYLRQHADNPVEWYEWGPEALATARRDRKPILLSIGYAACHWCHVMAHESFEDSATAAVMNDLFVNIKVDREERPDLDGIYMQAVQALTGHGGWPMTVFLTPDGVPFHGGTYFPPVDSHGIPSFQRVLRAVSNAWREKPDEVSAAGASLHEHLRRVAAPSTASGDVSARTLDLAFRSLGRAFDGRHCGFGGAPKFPPSMSLDFLLRHWARTGEELALDMVSRTHRAMREGGIHDQVGGGLHRYSVDARWLVPHFEKMLYDNALYARLGIHLWQATHDDDARRSAEQTIDWAMREMRDPGGGFYASLDADSEGEEGRFYVWDLDEFSSAAGADAEVAAAHWGVTADGNFEGRNILFVPHGINATVARTGLDADAVHAALDRARTRLYETRSRRPWPARDDKIIASWNGLFIRALVDAARAFDSERYADAAVAGATFLASRMVQDGRVTRSVLGEGTSGAGFLEDHAAVALAFLDVYSLTFDTTWLAHSDAVTRSAVARFHDGSSGTWYDTADDHEALIVRPREATDNALPSGTSLVAELLQRWSDLDDRPEWRELARGAVAAVGDGISQFPQAFGHIAGVADSLVNGTTQVALVGAPDDPRSVALRRRVGDHYIPGLVLAGGTGAAGPSLLDDRPARNGTPTAYVCRGFACEAPTVDPGVLDDQLAALREHPSTRGAD